LGTIFGVVFIADFFGVGVDALPLPLPLPPLPAPLLVVGNSSCGFSPRFAFNKL